MAVQPEVDPAFQDGGSRLLGFRKSNVIALLFDQTELQFIGILRLRF